MTDQKNTSATNGILLRDFQQLIHRMYFEKDVARGVDGTFMWFIEEIGELSSALRKNDSDNLGEEFADVLALRRLSALGPRQSARNVGGDHRRIHQFWSQRGPRRLDSFDYR